MIDKNFPCAVLEISNFDLLEFTSPDNKEKMTGEVFNKVKSIRNKHQDFNLMILLVVQEKANNLILKQIVIPEIERVLKFLKIKNYIYIVNSWQEDNYLKSNPNIVFSDTWAIRSLFFFLQKNEKFSDTWNPLSQNALFLIGKPDRIHRIGLLYKLLKENQIRPNLLWSLHLNDYYRQNLKKFIVDEITDQEFEEFLAVAVRKLDFEPQDLRYASESISYGSFAFDSQLYSNSLISIISESEFFPYKGKDVCDGRLIEDPFIQITEKTWKAMINRHPFIGVGRTEYLVKLKSLGFKTFEEYMLIPNYSTIVDNNERLSAVVENVKYFINVVRHDSEKVNAIRKDIEYNFKYFYQYVDNERKKLMDILGIKTQEELSQLIINE